MFESIGQRLKKEREARFLTLEKVSEATRIRVVFLQALELDDFSVMPSAAQGRGFLRNYAEYLGLNVDEMIADVQKNISAVTEISGPLPQVNLVETEVPPLTDSTDEKPEPPPTRKRGRRPKAESTDSISTDSIAEQPKPRERRKKKIVEVETPQLVEISTVEDVTEVKAADEILPFEMEQAEIKEDAQTNLFSKILNLFRTRNIKTEIESNEKNESVIIAQSEPFIPPQPADMILAEIGMKLRERRELISLTLDEVERHTKLRAVFIKALEDGAADKLPSPVQMRGMLANYATFLDLDVDAILLRFADALQARRHEKYAEIPREKIQMEVFTSLPRLRSFIAGDLIFGGTMIVVLAGLAIWGMGRMLNSQNEKNAQPTAYSIANAFNSTPLPTATLISVDVNVLSSTVTAEPLLTLDAPTRGVGANVTVSIFALERAFARISVDGEVVFEGRFAPGETKIFEAHDQVSVLTGNASALRVQHNGNDLGLMGNFGEVVSRVYLISGVALPTATIPPTPTNTLPATITSVPSSTPSATPTATINSQ